MPAAATCPKCGNPRAPGALDCPWCGIIYDRWKGAAAASAATAAPTTAAARPAPPPRLTPVPAAARAAAGPPPVEVEGLYQGPDLYEGPGVYEGPAVAAGAHDAIYRRPSMPPPEGPVTYFETPFTRALPVWLLLAGLLFIGLQAFFASSMLGASGDLRQAQTHFRLISGLEPPAGLDDAATINFVGRRVIMLTPGERPAAEGQGEGQVMAIVLHHGRLAGDASREELLGLVDRGLDVLGVPRFVVSEGEVSLRGRPATARTLGLGLEGRAGGRLFAVAFTAPDGRPALLVVAGPEVEVTDIARRYLL
jgi:hypothetical protein